MNELNEEIKLTLNTMQGDIDGGAHNELQYHLMSLLEIKRNELQQRLVERSWAEPVTHDQSPYKSVKLDGQIADEAKPLTAEELKAGGWWCSDVSDECRRSLIMNGMEPLSASWNDGRDFSSCCLHETLVVRINTTSSARKQIHRVGDEFYWSEK